MKWQMTLLSPDFVIF